VPAASGVDTVLTVPRNAMFNGIGIGFLQGLCHAFVFPQSSCPWFLNLQYVTRVPATSGMETLLTVPREALFNAICIGFLVQVPCHVFLFPQSLVSESEGSDTRARIVWYGNRSDGAS